jgi:hypothetical protein
MNTNFCFEDLTIYTKKCLYISNNKAIVRNIKLLNIGELINKAEYNNIYVEESFREAKDHNDISRVFVDHSIVCVCTGNTLDGYTQTDTITYRLEHIAKLTLDKTLTAIRSCPANNQFVNVADIKLIELSGASLEEVQGLIEYRQAWIDRKDKEEQEREQKKQQEEKEYVDKKNNELAEQVNKAEQSIANKQLVKNVNVTIYKSRYEHNTTSLILYMMKLYDISIPLKTQGWINGALAQIFWNEEWNEYSYRFYNTSKNSEVFYKYLRQLVGKINEKYGIIEKKKIFDPEIERLFRRTGV